MSLNITKESKKNQRNVVLVKVLNGKYEVQKNRHLFGHKFIHDTNASSLTRSGAVQLGIHYERDKVKVVTTAKRTFILYSVKNKSPKELYSSKPQGSLGKELKNDKSALKWIGLATAGIIIGSLLYRRGYPGKEEPPGPLQLPLTGNIKDIYPDLISSIPSLVKKFGKFVTIRIATQKIYIVSDQTAAYEILNIEDKMFPSTLLAVKLPSFTKKSVFSADGDLWKSQRLKFITAVNSLYHKLLMKFHPRLLTVVKNLRGKTALDMYRVIQDLSSDFTSIIGTGSTNYRESLEINEEVVKLADDVRAGLSSATFLIPGQAKKLENRTQNLRQKVICQLKETGRSEPNLANNLATVGEPCDSDTMFTLILASAENMNPSLFFALYYIVTSTYHYNKLTKELNAALLDSNLDKWMEIVNDLPYLHKVVMEVLRLRPFVHQAQRGAASSKTITTEDGKRYKLRAGSTIFIALGEMNLDPDYWGTTANQFDPDREKTKKSHLWSFGGGPRICPAQGLAIHFMKAIIAYMFRLCNFRYRQNQTLTQKGDIPLSGRLFDVYKLVGDTLDRPLTPPVNEQKRLKAKIQGIKKVVMYYATESPRGTVYSAATAVKGALVETKSSLESVEKFKFSETEDTLFVFFVSTYAGIDPQALDNLTQFLTEKRELGGMNYYIAGFGNTNWSETYQAAPKRLHAKLQQYGAKGTLINYNMGSAAVTREVASSVTADIGTILNRVFTLKGDITWTSTDETAEKIKWRNQSKVRTTNQHQGTAATLLTFPVEEQFSAGDHVELFPRNTNENVEKALGLLKMQRENLGKLGKTSSLYPEDTSITIGYVLDWLVDLNTRYSSEVHANLPVIDFSTENSKLIDVIQGNVTVEQLVNALENMKARTYSITSATGDCSVLVGRLAGGLCSNYVATIKAGDTIYYRIKKSKLMRFPEDKDQAVYCVSAGTGIAPFISLIQNEELLTTKRVKSIDKRLANELFQSTITEKPSQIARTIRIKFYFGTETPETSFMSYISYDNVKRYIAYSRTGQKQYVQDLLYGQRDEIKKNIEENSARFFICGKSKMVQEVIKIIQGLVPAEKWEYFTQNQIVAEFFD